MTWKFHAIQRQGGQVMGLFQFFGSSKFKSSSNRRDAKRDSTQLLEDSSKQREKTVLSIAGGLEGDSSSASWFDPSRGDSECPASSIEGSFTANQNHPATTSDSGIWKRGVPVTGLLQRHSIRAKLFFGIVMLVVTVIALTIVGLYGFYRYRDLADAISVRATELPMATHLNQWSAAARNSNTRICQMKAREGMIDSSVLAVPDLRLERAHFSGAMLELSLLLDRYGDAIGVSCCSSNYPHTSSDYSDCEPLADHVDSIPNGDLSEMLIDTNEQRASLVAIGKTIHEIDRMRQNPRAVAVYYQSGSNELSVKLAKLFEQTNDHIDLIHSQMAQFSDHVRSQHRYGIACAWGSLCFAAVVTIAMVVYFQLMVIGPFSNLVSGARLVASGEYGHTIDLGREDEIGELGGILNQMTDRFRKSMMRINELVQRQEEEIQVRTREVIRNEQLAGVGFLAAGFAHEINNPMAAIAWSAESLESSMNDLKMVPPDQRLLDEEMMESIQENLERIEGEAYRCKSITERMLSFSRVGHVQRELIDVVPLVEDVVELVHTLGKYQCENLVVDSSGPVMAYANSQEIRQVVLNLVTNAMESVDRDGNVTIRLRNQGSLASISVQDTGCGMSSEVMQHLFEPFYTRRRDGSGTGLGLSISYRIISQHGGQLIPRSEGVGKGSEMELRLPVEATDVADQKPNRTQTPQVAWRETAAA